MSDLPFGFGLPDRDPEKRDEPGQGGQGGQGEQGGQGGQGGSNDPFGLGALFGAFGGPGTGPGMGPNAGNPADLLGKMPLFAELQKLMSWSGGPVNWDLARQSA